tara:strand:- start:2839 stop:3636 length:798 start_codon:yes stop_codon:yes gene_type:complete
MSFLKAIAPVAGFALGGVGGAALAGLAAGSFKGKKKGGGGGGGAPQAPSKPKKTEYQKGQDKAQEILKGSGEGLMTQDMKDIMARRKQMSQEGLSQQEMGAMKNKVASQMLAAEQKASRGLGATLGQQKGAGAAAQQRALAESGMTARAGIERDLFLRQEEAKRQALTDYERTARFDVQKRAQAKEFEANLGFQYEGLQQQRESTAAQEAAMRGQKQKSQVGAGIGSAVGTVGGAVLGSAFGPAGTAIGGALGGSVGGLLGGLFD